ncbi:hypothetical protein BT96DRAFT_972846 [Gymnopus androsaceus JB14]|uniref:Uncharacterized protein n=1 Tax=Gymnopus androsaceus JB14 TaxID=1447944 RepID=A0A6A4I2V2_9AGAR|nr:hypothetical protein BT96DRAFT_972846 [Gymnopus androsaceus JB14]
MNPGLDRAEAHLVVDVMLPPFLENHGIVKATGEGRWEEQASKGRTWESFDMTLTVDLGRGSRESTRMFMLLPNPRGQSSTVLQDFCRLLKRKVLRKGSEDPKGERLWFRFKEDPDTARLDFPDSEAQKSRTDSTAERVFSPLLFRVVQSVHYGRRDTTALPGMIKLEEGRIEEGSLYGS